MAHPAARAVLRWGGYAVGLALLFHLAVAYTSSTVIDVGERAAATFLLGFWDTEQAPAAAGSFSYQWSTDHSTIDVPRVPAGERWTLMLRGWIEPALNPDGVWLAVDGGSAYLPATAGVRYTQLLLPRSGPVSLWRDAAADETRDVGFATDLVQISRVGTRLTFDWALVVLALELAAFGAFLVRAAELERRDAVLALLGTAALLSLALALYPLYALRAIPALMRVLPLALLAGMSALALVRRRGADVPGYVVAALALIVVLKAVGMFYPNYIGVDTAYHIRGVQAVIHGDLYRVGDGAGSVFPYPSGVYVALAPFSLLFGTIDWRALQWLVLLGSLLVDSSTIVLIDRILAHPAVSPRVRRWAALLYICLPAGYILFWHATVAQNLGQWFMVLYLTALIRFVTDRRRLTPFRALMLIALSCMACLGHFGVFLNFNLMFVLLVLTVPRFAYQKRGFVLTWAAGAVASVLIYYTVFWSVITGEMHHLTAEGAVLPSRWFIWDRMVWSLGLRDHYLGIYVVLALAGLGLVAWRGRRHPYFGALIRIFGAMLLTSALLGVLQVALLFNPTRYIIFSHTAIAIFAAFALAHMRRFRGGWLLTRILICVTLVWALALWAQAFALHADRAWLS